MKTNLTRRHCEFFERMTPDARLKYAADRGDKFHPGYSSHIESGESREA